MKQTKADKNPPLNLLQGGDFYSIDKLNLPVKPGELWFITKNILLNSLLNKNPYAVPPSLSASWWGGLKHELIANYERKK